MNLMFFCFELKKCFRVPIAWGLYGASGTRGHAANAVFGHFYHVAGFFFLRPWGHRATHSKGCKCDIPIGVLVPILQGGWGYGGGLALVLGLALALGFGWGAGGSFFVATLEVAGLVGFLGGLGG